MFDGIVKVSLSHPITISLLILPDSCQEKKQFPEEQDASTWRSTIFVATLENPIAHSILFAWDKIRKELNEAIRVDRKAKDFQLLNISKSFQNVLSPQEYTSFVEIESEARYEAVSEETEEEKPKPKKLIFDKPFTVFLKKIGSYNPYFGMWVADAELMVKE